MVENYGLLKKIPLGTMIRGSEKSLKALERFRPIGMETVEIFFWDTIPGFADLAWLEKLTEFCEEHGCVISSLGLYCNPLRNAESGVRAHSDWARLLNMAESFGITKLAGFTGRIPGQPVEASFEGIKSFFSPIAESCRGREKKLVFENCPMEGDRFSGDWNIAFLPEIWEVLFNDIFPDDTVGLEFDPAHLIPLGLSAAELLKEWMPRIFHVHGKDAESGPPHSFRFPGEGSLDWTELYAILQDHNYKGCIDLEGYHGTFVSHEREVEAQKRSMRYLKDCADRAASL